MTLKTTTGLTVLALTLALSSPVFAETAAPAAPVSPPPPSPMGMMDGPGYAGHPFREDMERMHKEQVDIDIARDQLLDKCIIAPKEKVADCKKERDDLKARATKLRDERKTMHEKMVQLRKDNEETRGPRHEGLRTGAPEQPKAAPPAAEPAAPAKE